jgi:WD40 repeat protein
VLSVAFGPQGKTVLSASADQTIRLWDIETGREIRRFAGHMMGVKSIALSPDRRIFVSGSDDGSIRLWDIETGLEVARVTLSQNVWNVAFGSDGLTIWSRSKSDNTIRLLKFDPPDNLIQWTCNNRYVRELTCTERLQYGVEPFCNEDGVPPVSGICQSVSAVAATE